MDIKTKKYLQYAIYFLFVLFLVLQMINSEIFIFETNDDQTMIDIAKGNFGKSSSYLIYTNFLLGFLFKIGYSLFPNIPIYPIFYIVTLILALVILAVIFKKHKFLFNLCLIFILFYIFRETLLDFNYTKFACIIGIAGILGIYNTLFNDNKIIYILSCILCMLSSLMRFDSFMMILLMFIPLAFYEMYKRGLKEFFNLKLIGFIVVVIFCIIANVINNSLYPEFIRFNQLRTEVLDYKLASINNTIISDNDIAMLNSWTFEDARVFNEEYFMYISSSIKDNINIINILINTIKNIYRAVLHNIFMKFVIFVVMLLGILNIKNKENIKKIIMALIGFFLVYLYLTYKGRIMYRVEFPLWVSLLMIVLYLNKFNNRFFLVTLSISCIICSITFFIGNNAYDKSMIDDISNKRTSLIEYCSDNKDNIYLMDTFTSIDYFYPLEIFEELPSEYMDNIILLGSYMTHSPIINNQLESFNLNSAIYDCINNDKCFVIDNKNVEIKKTYIKEHYDLNVDFVKVNGEESFNVYKLVKS